MKALVRRLPWNSEKIELAQRFLLHKSQQVELDLTKAGVRAVVVECMIDCMKLQKRQNLPPRNLQNRRFMDGASAKSSLPSALYCATGLPW